VQQDCSNEGPAGADSLQFLLLVEQLGYPSCQLFFQAQLFIENVVDCAKRHPIGQCKILDSNMPIFSDSGGFRGDESLSPLCFFGVQVLLVFGVFAGLNFP